MLMLALIAATLASVLGMMLWDGWGDFDEAQIDRRQLPADVPDAPPATAAPVITPATRPPAPIASGPAIHIPLASVRLWQDLPIVVRMLDEGTWRGRVHYRAGGAADWRSAELEDRGDGRLELSVPITEELGRSLEYWIELRRDGGSERVSRGSAAEPYSVSIL